MRRWASYRFAPFHVKCANHTVKLAIWVSATLLNSNHSCCWVTLIASTELLPPITLGCNPCHLMNCQVGFQVQGKPQPETPTSPAQRSAGTGAKGSKGKEKKGICTRPWESGDDLCLFWLMEDPGEKRGKYTLEASSVDLINCITIPIWLWYSKKVQWVLCNCIWHLS